MMFGKQFGHRLFVGFLLSSGTLCAIIIGVKNFSYYTTPVEKRPFSENYDRLKPSGIESHGYGVIGSAMIIVGVAMYSSRKRIHALSNIGRIKHFLEFHIFLCLTGPMLVLYHTTFKFGGLVAVSFWSMTAVVASGIVGRYLYVQIPKGIQGDELSIKALEEENLRLYHKLKEDYSIDAADIRKIDALAVPRRPMVRSFTSLLTFFIVNDVTRRLQVQKIVRHLHGMSVDAHTIKKVSRVANERIKLLRRMQFLEQLKTVFHYWHIIHLPFSIVMFVILFIHIGVTVLFGYTWIF